MPAFIVMEGHHITEPQDIAPHEHSAFELLFIVAGECHLSVEGSHYTLNSKDVAFIGAMEEHSLTVMTTAFEMICFTLSPGRLDHRIGNPQLTAIFKNRPSRFCHSCQATASTESLMRKILYEIELRDALSEDMIACYLHELLTEQYRKNPRMFPMPESSMKPRVYQVKAYLDSNFANDIKVSELADIFYVNKYYLSHMFRALTGYSPKQYLQLNRLTHGKKLLTTTSLPIKQIALDCGFPDSNSFIRNFKNEFGVTPNRSRHDAEGSLGNGDGGKKGEPEGKP